MKIIEMFKILKTLQNKKDIWFTLSKASFRKASINLKKNITLECRPNYQ